MHSFFLGQWFPIYIYISGCQRGDIQFSNCSSHISKRTSEQHVSWCLPSSSWDYCLSKYFHTVLICMIMYPWHRMILSFVLYKKMKWSNYKAFFSQSMLWLLVYAVQKDTYITVPSLLIRNDRVLFIQPFYLLFPNF